DVAGGDGDGNRIRDGDTRSAGVKGILSQELRIGGVDVNRAMHVQAASVLIAEAEFPGAGDFAFDGEIGLLGVPVFEICGDGQREGKNWQREAGGQIVLVGEERTGSERIEALLIWEKEHVGERVQDALENRGAVEV